MGWPLQPPSLWLTAILAIFGAVTGAIGLVVSIFNFRRDRARLEIGVCFNMAPPDAPMWMTMVSIRNIGRRPVHVSHVALSRTRFWRFGRTLPTFVLHDGLPGKTLAEGSPPWSVPAQQIGDGFDRLTKPGYVRAYLVAGHRVVQSKAFKVPDEIERYYDGVVGIGARRTA